MAFTPPRVSDGKNLKVFSPAAMPASTSAGVTQPGSMGTPFPMQNSTTLGL